MKRQGYNIFLRCTVIAAALTFLIVIANRIFLPLYQNVFAQDVTLEVIATGEKNEDALGNNVRIFEIKKNGVSEDLSKIKCSGNWNYLNTDNFLYAYNSEDEDTLTIKLSGVVSLEVSFVSEVGSGIVNLNINGQRWKQIDLYSDSEWSTVSFRYDTSPLVYAEEHTAIYLLLFTLSGIAMLFQKDEKRTELFRLAEQILILSVLSLVICVNTYIIQFSSFESIAGLFDNGYLVVLEGYILVFLILLIADFLIRKTWISFSGVAFTIELMTIVSNEKIVARGTPLLPWDFSMLNEALSVAGGYDFSASVLSILTIVETIFIAVVLFLLQKQTQWTNSKLFLVISVGITAAMLIAFFQTTVYPGIWNQTEGSRVYQIDKYYESKGFIVAFAEYTSYLVRQKAPEGYSREEIETLSNSIVLNDTTKSMEEQGDEEQPNIIVIMSESFWDINRLENVQFQENPLPVFTSLQQESLYGNLLSHVFGGNTVVSEFEVLTGLSGSYFPTDYMVYGGFMQKGFPSAVSILESQGYRTMALHPYIGTNYNRNVAYDYMGFDQCIFIDDFPKETETARNYISDQALFEQMETEFEQLKAEADEPVFMFAVTMQNHGGYWGSTLMEDSQVSFTADGYNEDTIDCMSDYFAGLHASDQALGELISYFRDVDEKTIIVFFGDHMSDAGTKSETMLSKESWYKEEEEYEYQAHLVPFLIWSNKSTDSEDLGLMEISQLLPTTFERNGISMPCFWEFVLSSRELYAAASKSIVVSLDMSVDSYLNMTDAQAEFWKEYQFLQYDHIWGQDYSEALWKLP